MRVVKTLKGHSSYQSSKYTLSGLDRSRSPRRVWAAGEFRIRPSRCDIKTDVCASALTHIISRLALASHSRVTWGVKPHEASNKTHRSSAGFPGGGRGSGRRASWYFLPNL